jgi:hypothetical protein
MIHRFQPHSDRVSYQNAAHINPHVTLDAVLTKSTLETKGEVRLLALWPFILVVAILAIVALVSDASFTADQRIQVFQQSGFYP